MSGLRVLMHSFKGGAGRTVSTANIAYILATELNHRVVLIDLDVESAGTAVLFGLDAKMEKKGQEALYTLQDILRGMRDVDLQTGTKEQIRINVKTFESDPWPRLHAVIHEASGGGYLKVIPSRAILRSPDEVKGGAIARQNFEHLIRKIEGLSQPPDIILFDSAAGLQDTAMLGLRVANILMIYARWSRQFISGTIRFLREYIKQTQIANKLIKVYIVPTAVPAEMPTGKMRDQLETRMADLNEAISEINDDARKHAHQSRELVTLLKPVRESAVLKWDDRVLLMDPLADGTVVEEILNDYRAVAFAVSNACKQLERRKQEVRQRG